MKIFKLFLVLVTVLGLQLSAKDFSKMSKHPTLLQSGKAKMWCHVCGMSLKMFYKTSHAVKLKDGSARQYCSIRCLVVDYPKIKDRVKEILVADAKSGKMIDVNKAFYVVGSKVKGTMSKVSKVAFSREVDAKAFQKEFSGKIVSFKEAFELAKKNLKADMMMLNMKKKMMIFPKGKMIYKKMCKSDVDGSKFATIGELKSYLMSSKVCGDVKGKKLQMLALYIKGGKEKTKGARISVPKDAKCPVCGMFVAKFPRWVAEVVLSDGKKLYFDGAKDMFKYLLSHKASKKSILVNDYYHQVAINAKDAFFVVGSNVLGPMGNELIPFLKQSDAKTFMRDHNGKKILKYSEINSEVVKGL